MLTIYTYTHKIQMAQSLIPSLRSLLSVRLAGPDLKNLKRCGKGQLSSIHLVSNPGRRKKNEEKMTGSDDGHSGSECSQCQ